MILGSQWPKQVILNGNDQALTISHADVAELADSLDSGKSDYIIKGSNSSRNLCSEKLAIVVTSDFKIRALGPSGGTGRRA